MLIFPGFTMEFLCENFVEHEYAATEQLIIQSLPLLYNTGVTTTSLFTTTVHCTVTCNGPVCSQQRIYCPCFLLLWVEVPPVLQCLDTSLICHPMFCAHHHHRLTCTRHRHHAAFMQPPAVRSGPQIHLPNIKQSRLHTQLFLKDFLKLYILKTSSKIFSQHLDNFRYLVHFFRNY